MAPASRLFRSFSFCLLVFVTSVSLANAAAEGTPHSWPWRPDPLASTRTGDNPDPRTNPASAPIASSSSSSSSSVALSLVDDDHHANAPAKRDRQPVGSWGDQYALAHGWSVTVTTLSAFLTFGSSSAAYRLDDFYRQIQAACLAKMLSGSSYVARLRFAQGAWTLVLAVHPLSTGGRGEIEWAFAYHFATYMRNWVRNGFTGTGAVMFQHTSGVKLVAFFLNMEGSMGSVLYEMR